MLKTLREVAGHASASASCLICTHMVRDAGHVACTLIDNGRSVSSVFEGMRPVQG